MIPVDKNKDQEKLAVPEAELEIPAVWKSDYLLETHVDLAMPSNPFYVLFKMKKKFPEAFLAYMKIAEEESKERLVFYKGLSDEDFEGCIVGASAPHFYYCSVNGIIISKLFIEKIKDGSIPNPLTLRSPYAPPRKLEIVRNKSDLITAMEAMIQLDEINLRLYSALASTGLLFKKHIELSQQDQEALTNVLLRTLKSILNFQGKNKEFFKLFSEDDQDNINLYLSFFYRTAKLCKVAILEKDKESIMLSFAKMNSVAQGLIFRINSRIVGSGLLHSAEDDFIKKDSILNKTRKNSSAVIVPNG